MHHLRHSNSLRRILHPTSFRQSNRFTDDRFSCHHPDFNCYRSFLLCQNQHHRRWLRHLLQVKDYTPQNKLGRKKMCKYATIYWLIMTAIYLGYSFSTENWEHSWIVWPISGITYSILEKIFSMKSDGVASD